MCCERYIRGWGKKYFPLLMLMIILCASCSSTPTMKAEEEMLVDVSTTNTFAETYSDYSNHDPVYDRDRSLTCGKLYETQSVSIKSLILDTLNEWGTRWAGRSAIYRYLDSYDGYDVILPSTYSHSNLFQYVTLWNAANQGVSDGILFIGKDTIAANLDFSYESLYDTRNIMLDLCELIPC